MPIEPSPAFPDDAMWRAVLARDAACDGRFFYAVLTTGVYCRPSCPSRRPLRRNVRFFENAAEAERAGFRACLRCRPGQPEALDERLRRACDTLRAHADAPAPLAALARQAGLSPSHFQRAFKAALGVTPREFHARLRLERFKGVLKNGSAVTAAVYAAGYGSPSRVYESADARLGMTPAQYARGAAGLAIRYVVVETSLGWMTLAATDRGLCAIQFAASAAELPGRLRAEFPAARIEPAAEPYSAQLQGWIDALREHLAGRQPALDLPLDLRATAFQSKVWRYLQSIPYGSVESYSGVAAALGQPTAARAVARACAANRVALVIPCHRVIRESGELGGYRWGLERKRALIEGERRAGGVPRE
jgi:AraC family transcriptional regulator of adaptative response/methylated-DNA-[protein]-cysteine methyltransferase